MKGGDAVDAVTYEFSKRKVVVNLTTGEATGEGTDALTSIGSVVGSPKADTITGNKSFNAILGQGGADTIHGRGGADTLIGAGGNDHLYGEKGNDQLEGGAGTDELFGGAGGKDTCLTGETLSGCEDSDAALVSLLAAAPDSASDAGGDRPILAGALVRLGVLMPHLR